MNIYMVFGKLVGNDKHELDEIFTNKREAHKYARNAEWGTDFKVIVAPSGRTADVISYHDASGELEV